MYGIRVPEKKPRLPVSYWVPRRPRALVLVVPMILCLVIIRLAPVLAHDDPHNSIKEITLQMQQDPNNAELYLKRGELHRISAHWDLALADFDGVAQLQPNHESVDFHRGRLLFGAGQFQPARTALDRLLSAHPNHIEGLIVRGRLLRKLGQPLDAAADYAHALSLAPNPTPVLFIEQAEALAKAGEAYVGAAVRSLDEGIEKLGPLVLLESRAIDLEVRRQRYDAALVRIDQVLAELSRKEKWLARRGEILEKAGRFEEARATYEDALKAIESLPSRLRWVPASQELETHLRALLARDSY